MACFGLLPRHSFRSMSSLHHGKLSYLCLHSTGIALTSQNAYQAVDKALQDLQSFNPNKVPLEQVCTLVLIILAVILCEM